MVNQAAGTGQPNRPTHQEHWRAGDHAGAQESNVEAGADSCSASDRSARGTERPVLT